MTEGIIIRWLINEGDSISEGQDLFEVETDKLTMNIPAAVSGTLLKILRKPGDTVPVAEPIAIIGAPGEDISGMAGEDISGMSGEDISVAPGEDISAAPGEDISVTPGEDISAAPGEDISAAHAVDRQARVFATPRAKEAARLRGIDYRGIPGSGPGGLVIESDITSSAPLETYREASKPVKATPLARMAAKLEGVNLEDISGSGRAGQILPADVRDSKRRSQDISPERGAAREVYAVRETNAAREVYAAAREPDALSSERGETLIPLTGMRRTIATRMKASLNEMAQLYHRVTVDMSEAAVIRESLKKAGQKVSYNDIILWCTAKALTEYPVINSVWSDNGIVQKQYVNLGVAVALDEGLIVPVIKDADLMSLLEITACSQALAIKAKQSKLARDEYTGGTFTVSNLGMFDIDSFTAIINPPEAGILAVGKIVKQPAVVDDEIVIRPLVQLSLTYDHRVVDGAPAARFLRRIKELLENP